MNPTMNAPKCKGRVYEQSLDKYFELTESDKLAKLVASIREAQDHDERRELKANLPFRCPHYFRFKDDRRSQATIIPEAFTWQTCIDIDDASQVEGAITLNGMTRRCDIVVYDSEVHPMMIVECKREDVPLTQKVVDQACRYNLILQVPYLLLTNGRQELCCRVEMTEKRLVGLEKVPEWHKKC